MMSSMICKVNAHSLFHFGVSANSESWSRVQLDRTWYD